jgi:hypothetical protein
LNDILNKFKQENESLKKNLNEKYEKLSNFERSFCNVRSINVNALSKPLYNSFFKGKKSHMRLFKTKAVQKDKTNVMDKCKNMCLDDVNEPIDHYKINIQKNNEIQKRLNNLDKNKRKAVSMLVKSDFNSILKQSLLFSGILIEIKWNLD